MKNYRITVNHVAYDVTVEEVPAGQAAVENPAPQPSAPHPAAKPAPPRREEPKVAGAAGSVPVTAPMPGKILAVKVTPGQSVKKGEVLLVLEAMKMENEIVAPSDGEVASVNAAVGDTVEAGSTIVTLK